MNFVKVLVPKRLTTFRQANNQVSQAERGGPALGRGAITRRGCQGSPIPVQPATPSSAMPLCLNASLTRIRKREQSNVAYGICMEKIVPF